MKQLKQATRLLPFLLLAAGPAVHAQQIPGAGSQLKQLPSPPAREQPRPEVRIEEATTPVATTAGSVRALVTELQVAGATAYPAAELVAVSGFTPGRELTLADLQ
ncbi:MAG TPA: ShlB/FhaC/HecB family hemolysin secretion/activation protein, partial [Xanthomonadaceae bacterium]|nr:ShlB/FhaC/HecB family hemolysin secretion/activation protein [Xanthomonadaceae bacterium]